MANSSAHARIYREAAELNRQDPLLRGSLLHFPDYGQLVMTGDLHGHQRNLERIQTFCDLEHAPARHVILHEIVHAELESFVSTDMSHLVLLQAARWKRDFPEQVHFIHGNHELSQLTRHEISKGGRIVTKDFMRGVEVSYGDGFEEVYDAILEFISSFALAGRTKNRVFLSHSLPGHRDVARFDPAIFDAPFSDLDLSEHGSVYPLVWGRYQTEEAIEHLATILDVDTFICGHQPQEDGYEIRHDRMLIIASDHNHGVFLPFDLKKSQSIDDLVRVMRPIASIA
jgi:hypothetical protein